MLRLCRIIISGALSFACGRVGEVQLGVRVWVCGCGEVVKRAGACGLGMVGTHARACVCVCVCACMGGVRVGNDVGSDDDEEEVSVAVRMSLTLMQGRWHG